MSSGGPGSGMFKSTDGGETWTEMTRNPGMPQSGLVGRIGLAVSPANSDRVYALFENDDGGLFSSDDAGAHPRRGVSPTRPGAHRCGITPIAADDLPRAPGRRPDPAEVSHRRAVPDGVVWI